MDAPDFEYEVNLLVEALGYRRDMEKPGHFSTFNVVASKDGRKYVVQCNLDGPSEINRDAMKQLAYSKSLLQIQNGVYIATGLFSDTARQIASSESIEIIDLDKLIKLCKTRHITLPSLTYLISQFGDVFDIRPDTTTIGRDQLMHIQLLDASVSRHHAALHRHGLQLLVEDEGSKHGTFVNGVKIIQPEPLNYFDEIRFAGIRARVALATPMGLRWSPR